MFFGNNHSETTNPGQVYANLGQNDNNGGPMFLSCINEAGNVPPQASDFTTGAFIAPATGQSLYMDGYLFVYGLTLALSGSGNNTLSLCYSDQRTQEYINCTFDIGTTNSSAQLHLCEARKNGRTVFRNCSAIFREGAQTISPYGFVRWYGGSIGVTGTQISSGNALFNGQGYYDAADYLFKGCDFSGAMASGAYLIAAGGLGGNVQIRLEDCKLPTNLSATPLSVGHFYSATGPSHSVEFSRCGATYEYAKYSQPGAVFTDLKTTRTGGATDGTTHYGLHIVTDPTYCDPYAGYMECPMIIQWNPTSGAPVVVDVYGISWDSALPTNNEVWMEVDYEDDGSSTLTTRVSTRMATYLSTPASNGRLYLCVTAGTSAGSTPGGYASATDGTNITDGGAHFLAGYRFKIETTLNSPDPAVVGNISVTVCFGKPGTLTYAIDPLVVL
jgi:hypothetical protein